MIIVLFNAVIGFRQEYAAEKIIESLKKMASPQAKVIRDRRIITIHSTELVPGDVLVLEAGSIIPADARITECHDFHIHESILTGASAPVAKTWHPVYSDKITNAKNMVFSGTTIVRGKAYAVVTATGNNTELGQIAKIMEETKTEIPLVKKLKKLSMNLTLVTVGVILLTFVIGVFYKYDLITMFKTSISLGVAAIPESLPVVVTVALVLGIKKIAEKQALIRKIPAIETIGSIDVIFLDKTGTVTRNEMTVTKICLPSGEFDVSGIGYNAEGTYTGKANVKDLKMLLSCAYVCNDAEHMETYTGDPTEVALIIAGEKYMKQFSDVLPSRVRKKTKEFTSERKMMTVVSDLQYTKGAPEKIINRCTTVLVKGRIKTFTKSMKKDMIKKSEHMMEDALRVLAFAYKKSGRIQENEMVFIGLGGMLDPPREGVDKTVEHAHNAGIKVKIITGDHAITAKAVAKMIGICSACKVVTGDEINNMIKTNDPFLEQACVFARVTTGQKINIIDYFENKGYTTAMTGDGVNDAPALKRASIGIAVAEATDVAKSASQMILLKTHFKTILNAIELGRGVMDNIKKFILYLLTSNIAEVGVVALSTILRFPVPLTPVQLLWINLVTDGPPAVALALDPPAKDIMLRKPEGKHKSIISKRITHRIICVSALMIILLMFLVYISAYDVAYLSTMVFTALVMFETIRVISVRKEFGQPLLNNKMVIVALVLALMLQICIIYVPIPGNPFNVVPLELSDWAILILLSGVLFIADNIVNKIYVNLNVMSATRCDA
jgi:Ca2+-transporting ATPase